MILCALLFCTYCSFWVDIVVYSEKFYKITLLLTRFLTEIIKNMNVIPLFYAKFNDGDKYLKM
jgi:hypothetical protein